MLKALIVADGEIAKKLLEKLKKCDIQISAMISPMDYDGSLPQKQRADFIVTEPSALLTLASKEALQSRRQQVKAVTHQGIRLVPIENIFYFQAEHKYVTAEHVHGQLLIEDSLNSLEHEFADLFVRIHRKYLVAKSQIEIMQKNDKGQYYIKLRNREEQLMVSRRQLPNVRKSLLCL